MCCEDHEHCCPQFTKCDVAKLKCNDGKMAVPWFKKSPSLGSSSTLDNSRSGITAHNTEKTQTLGVLHCDDDQFCGFNQTCCEEPNGVWGCCPFPQVSWTCTLSLPWLLITSTTESEGRYVFTPFFLFVNCRNPSDFGNYVGRLCVSFCVCLSVCVFVYPVAATPFQRS